MDSEFKAAQKLYRALCPPTNEKTWQDVNFPGRRTPNTFEAGQRIMLTKPGYDLSDDVVTIKEIHYYSCDGSPDCATKFYVFASARGAKGTMPERAFPKSDWKVVDAGP